MDILGFIVGALVDTAHYINFVMLTSGAMTCELWDGRDSTMRCLCIIAESKTLYFREKYGIFRFGGCGERGECEEREEGWIEKW